MQHPNSNAPFSPRPGLLSSVQAVRSAGNAESSTGFLEADGDFCTFVQLLKIIAVFFVFVVCHHFGRSLGQTV